MGSNPPCSHVADNKALECSDVHLHHPSPAPDLQPARLVEPRRAIGRADRAGGGTDRRRAAARGGRRPNRPAADRADTTVHPVRDPGRFFDRPDVAAPADGVGRSAAGDCAGRHPAADLVQAADAVAARAGGLRRGVRDGRLQRRGAGPGAIAGSGAIATRRQRPDRAGAHHRLRQRPCAGRRAGRMGRRGASLRICCRAVGACRGAAVGHL